MPKNLENQYDILILLLRSERNKEVFFGVENSHPAPWQRLFQLWYLKEECYICINDQ